MRKLYIFFILCIISLSINAQNNVGIGTNTPDPSAKLDILAADKGLLIPRVNLTGTGDVATITTPATGLLVFNEAAAGSGATAVEANSFYYYNGSKWVKLQSNNPKDWTTLGNADADITAPAAPATYGTSTFGSSENWIGTIGSDDFTVGTSNIERIRIKSDGKTGIGTATPTANYLMTINPTNNTLRGGIDMTLSGMTSAANGINITTGVSAVNGINVTHSSGSLTTSLFGIGGVLSSTNIVSGYLGYRNGSGKSYGVMGINGTTGSYATNANTWAGYFNGRTVITSENSPTSPLGVDLEVQNTTAGSGNPATIQLRQTTANTTSGNTLTNLNFGDATVTTPQAQINVSRDQASGGSADMPTRMTFSTTPDGSSTLSERMRIDNAGNVGINTINSSSGSTVPQDRFQVFPTGGKDIILGGGVNTGSEIKLTNTGTANFSLYNSGNNKLTFANTTSAFTSNTAGTTIMTLDNSNNVAIPNGYLTVGNTSTRDVQNATYNVYSHSFTAGDGGWLRSNPTSCGNTQKWVYQSDGGNTWSTCGLRWDNETAQNADGMLSPWIWIPTNSGGSVTFGMETYLDLETGYDGCYIQYTTNGSTWTKVLASDFGVGPYENTGTPGGTQCSSTGVGTNGFFTGYIYQKYRRFSLSLSGTWVRFRFTAFCDNSGTTGYGMYLYGFSANVTNTTPATTTAYAPGNIYAQNNVYAGNNVLRGDVAEYFPVDTKSEPGTLIAIKDGFADQYTISKKLGDDRVIGIQSTNPTLLINNPKSGIPVALTGRVPVKVNNEGGKIKIGDYLIASSTPGVATKTDKAAYVIGRALENFDGKTGTILCLVQNGFYNPGKSFDMERSLGSFTSNDNSNKIIVYDNSITPKSKIFMTYRNKVGSENWVSKIEQGYFEVQFDKTLDHSVQFDYLVENANLNKSNDFSSNSPVTIIDNSKFDEITANIKSDEIKKTEPYIEDQVMKEIMSNGNIKTYTLPVETSTALPPAPLDVTKGAAWTASKGLFIADSKVRTEEEFYDCFKKIKAKINKY